MTDEINIISLFGGRKSLPTPIPFGPSRIPIPWLLYSVSCFLRVFGLVGGPALQFLPTDWRGA